MKIRVTQRTPYTKDFFVTDVDADEIGGADGECILFKNEKVVAIFAKGLWVSALKVDPGSLPS